MGVFWGGEVFDVLINEVLCVDVFGKLISGDEGVFFCGIFDYFCDMRN